MTSLAENLIKKHEDYGTTAEELATILEEVLCDECKKKLNNVLANKFVEDNT